MAHEIESTSLGPQFTGQQNYCWGQLSDDLEYAYPSFKKYYQNGNTKFKHPHREVVYPR